MYTFDDVQTRGGVVDVVLLLQQRQQSFDIGISHVAITTVWHIGASLETEAGHDLPLNHKQSCLLVPATSQVISR